MWLIDVNVLVYAFREDAPDHETYRRWLETTLRSDALLGLAEPVLSGFLRITTHPRVFDPPSPAAESLRFLEILRSHPNCLSVLPGPRHWEIFTRLCLESGATGNLIPDAYLAAITIEVGGDWVTTDRDFGKFAGLKWRHPLA